MACLQINLSLYIRSFFILKTGQSLIKKMFLDSISLFNFINVHINGYMSKHWFSPGQYWGEWLLRNIRCCKLPSNGYNLNTYTKIRPRYMEVLLNLQVTRPTWHWASDFDWQITRLTWCWGECGINTLKIVFWNTLSFKFSLLF